LKLSLQTVGNRLCLLLRGEPPDMDPIAPSVWKFNNLYPDIGIVASEPASQGLSISLLGKGRYLDAKVTHGPGPPLIGDHPDLDLVRPHTDHAKSLGPGLG